MTWTNSEIWTIIGLLAVGTFAIRFSFLGLLGGATLPPVVLRLLRYTPVAVIPGMVAPLVLWPQATGGQTDLPRLLAALVTFGVGVWTKNLIASILSGAATLYAGLWLSGGLL